MQPKDWLAQIPEEPMFKVVCQQLKDGMYQDVERSGLVSGSVARTFIEDLMFDYYTQCQCGKCECV